MFGYVWNILLYWSPGYAQKICSHLSLSRVLGTNMFSKRYGHTKCQSDSWQMGSYSGFDTNRSANGLQPTRALMFLACFLLSVPCVVF